MTAFWSPIWYQGPVVLCSVQARRKQASASVKNYAICIVKPKRMVKWILCTYSWTSLAFNNAVIVYLVHVLNRLKLEDERLVTEEDWPSNFWEVQTTMHQLHSMFRFWFVFEGAYARNCFKSKSFSLESLLLSRAPVCCVFQGTHHEQAWWKCTTVSCPREKDLSSRKHLVDLNGQVMLLREDEVVYCISKKLLRGKVTSVALQIRLDVSFLSLKQMPEFAVKLWGAACFYFSYGSVCKPHLSVICIWTLLVSVS